jgi:hypothetical protein
MRLARALTFDGLQVRLRLLVPGGGRRAGRRASLGVGLGPRVRFRAARDDIIIEDGDIFGDGVNIAARLEALAEPGGICISSAAHEQVRDKLDFSFEDMGEQQVKNIARPVRTHRIVVGSTAQPITAAVTELPLPDKPSLVVLPFQNLTGDTEQEISSTARSRRSRPRSRACRGSSSSPATLP